MLFTWPCLALLAQGYEPSSVRVTVKEHVTFGHDWKIQRRADPTHKIKVQVILAQPNFGILENHIAEISDPQHERYRQHMTAAEVDNILKLPAQDTARVLSWLAEYHISPAQVTSNPAGDWLSFEASVGSLERMLHAEYNVYERASNGFTEVVRTNKWSLPSTLYGIIDTIQPTTSLFGFSAESDYVKRQSATPSSDNLNQLADDYEQSTQGVDLLNVPENITVSEACHEEAMTPLCLRRLYGTLGYQTQTRDSSNKMALANFHGEFNHRSDIARFLEIYRPDSTASAELFSNVNLAGGENYQEDASQEQFEHGHGKEGNLDAQYMLGIAHPVPLVTFTVGGSAPAFISDMNNPTNTNEPFLTLIDYLLRQPSLPQVLSISYGDSEQTVPEAYARRVCQGFAALGARGVSIIFGSGDHGVGSDPETCISNLPDHKPRFITNFPDSCPYVTSVGATRGFSPEVVANDDPKHFVSGGGFSMYFERPVWQDKVVSRYLKDLPEETKRMFNVNGRAYPDVAAQGYKFSVIWNGTTKLVDGTSASAPTFAGIIALINDALLSEGKPALGFLNPFLYSSAPSTFTDITNGTTRGCGVQGFHAASGWDAASGWGTPWFPELKRLALQAQFRGQQPWYID